MAQEAPDVLEKAKAIRLQYDVLGDNVKNFPSALRDGSSAGQKLLAGMKHCTPRRVSKQILGFVGNLGFSLVASKVTTTLWLFIGHIH